MSPKKIYMYLAAILFLAMVLRFYGLAGRGLFYGDETRYYRDAARIKASVQNYLAASVPKAIRSFLGAVSVVDKNSFAGKPGHTLLGVMGLYIFGDHQYSVLFISALLGIATILLVFFIGYKFYDLKTGIIAAFILSICPTHILFSRSFLTHSNQAFFLVLAVYLYLKKSAPYLLCGLCLGYAFLVHPTGLIYFGPFLLCEIFFWLRKKRKFSDIVIFSLVFLIPFFVTTAISIFGKKEFGSLAVALKDSYAEQLIYTSSDAAHRGDVTNKNLGLWHYLVMSWLSNGAIFTVTLVLSALFCLGYIFKKREVHNFIILAVPLLLYCYWQFISNHERLFREILVLFPFFCIMAAVFISRLNKKIAVMLMFLLLLEGAWYCVKVITSVKSEYPKLEKFLAENKINKVVTPSEYLASTSDVLLPGSKALKIYIVSNKRETRAIMKKEDINHIITLPGEWLEGREFRFNASSLLRIPEPSFAYYPSFYEIVKTQNKIEYLKYRNNPDAVSVAIYDLRKEDS